MEIFLNSTYYDISYLADGLKLTEKVIVRLKSQNIEY